MLRNLAPRPRSIAEAASIPKRVGVARTVAGPAALATSNAKIVFEAAAVYPWSCRC